VNATDKAETGGADGGECTLRRLSAVILSQVITAQNLPDARMDARKLPAMENTSGVGRKGTLNLTFTPPVRGAVMPSCKSIKPPSLPEGKQDKLYITRQLPQYLRS
jgi:hypothetical protein